MKEHRKPGWTTAVNRLAMIFFMVWALLLSAAEQAAAGQWLLGTLCIDGETGQRVYGERITVFLTTEKLPIPHCQGIDTLERHQRLDRINQLHLDFYKAFAARRNRSGYLIGHTESSDTGNFAFLDAPAGDYWVVVTFPAMINGHKVAWQQKVTVTKGHVRHITLDEKNLALPADRRE